MKNQQNKLNICVIDPAFLESCANFSLFTFSLPTLIKLFTNVSCLKIMCVLHSLEFLGDI